jgi:hypothetical protein
MQQQANTELLMEEIDNRSGCNQGITTHSSYLDRASCARARRIKEPEVRRTHFAKRSRADHNRIRGRSQKGHDEMIARVVTCDFPSARFAGNWVTHDAIRRCCEFAIT